MNHSNMYAVGLALCTFANIASEEMSRDLVNEIEKLLGSSNTYIRKKVRLRVLEPLDYRHSRLRVGCALRFTSHQKGS
jgi:AP-1 complex subunit gamma-1